MIGTSETPNLEIGITQPASQRCRSLDNLSKLCSFQIAAAQNYQGLTMKISESLLDDHFDQNRTRVRGGGP